MMKRFALSVARSFGASAAFPGLNVSLEDAFTCLQCEQSKAPCNLESTCGKSAEVAVLQDILVENLKHLADFVDAEKCECENLMEIKEFLVEAMYSTLTNVNFDETRFVEEYIGQIEEYAGRIKKHCGKKHVKKFHLPRSGELDDVGSDEFFEFGSRVSIPARVEEFGEDIASLQELVAYGLKGYAAYLYEASILGDPDPALYDTYTECLGFLSREGDHTIESLVGCAMKVGEGNVGVMAALDAFETEQFGSPSPAEVATGGFVGNAILVSGHNLDTLRDVLEQTEGTGINVYTHGEMLPAHGYPELRAYPHLVGHYGTAWQSQHREFGQFPGSILMTTNCLLKPTNKYAHRIFSHAVVGHEDVAHIEGDDFSPLIDAALAEPGYRKNRLGKYNLMTGFGHEFILSLAPVIIDAVKAGDIEHFWLVGGCDGVKQNRNYFTDLVNALPDNHVILTLGCGKYKFNHLQEELGTIKTGEAEIPRLLDMGQCNDAYGAVVVASALTEAFGLESVNDLPLSMCLSWFEQKAVVILLSLLNLGVQNIRIGPSLPAFVSDNVLSFLVENFNLQPTMDPLEDIETMLGGK